MLLTARRSGAAIVPLAVISFASLVTCSSGRPALGGSAFVPSAQGAAEGALAVCASPSPAAVDGDGDGLADECEQALAERFAPIVYHAVDESNYPTNVDSLLHSTTLSFYDDACAPDLKELVLAHVTQLTLLAHSHGASCGSQTAVSSSGTRSRRKRRTFFLGDVAEGVRGGSDDPSEWATYVHAYKNDVGGVTLQYWRVYPYNDSWNDHGGDWEGAHIVLDRTLSPVIVRLLGHSGIAELPFGDLEREGEHVRLFSEPGGHATRASGEADGMRQETWTHGEVRDDGRLVGETGPLINVGAREAPLNEQRFIQYSGLWGSPGMLFAWSGYWGPAYNETDLRADGFVTAWCAGMVGANVASECFAPNDAP